MVKANVASPRLRNVQGCSCTHVWCTFQSKLLFDVPHHCQHARDDGPHSFGYLLYRFRSVTRTQNVVNSMPVPSVGHHQLLAHFLFNGYQTWYAVYSTVHLHAHKF